MKKAISIILAAALCFGMSGCSLLNDEIADRKSGREECVLNEKDASIFVYDGTEYRILENTADKDKLGEWVGYIQKLAILDQQYAVLETRELNSFNSNRLPEEAVYMIQYLNIYQGQDGKSLIIDVDGGFHHAVPKDQAGDAEVIVLEASQENVNGEITIDESNCTKIRIGSSVYQMTDTKISDSELGDYLGVIGTVRVFDSETKQEIPKEDIEKIELEPGALSRQGRTSWTYGMVFDISGIDKKDSIAVEINHGYLRADMIK